MSSTTVATHGATATTTFSSRRVSAALAAAALLVTTLFVAVLLAVQSGQNTHVIAVSTQEQLQQDSGINQAPDPGSVRGRPY